jgi:hypothetical protein
LPGSSAPTEKITVPSSIKTFRVRKRFRREERKEEGKKRKKRKKLLHGDLGGGLAGRARDGLAALGTHLLVGLMAGFTNEIDRFWG